MRPRWLIAGLLLVAAVAAGAGWARRPRIPAAERGRRLAERLGCFGCHGPEGIRGTVNPGRSDRTVPGYEGDLMMFAHDATQVGEWIRDGVSAKKAKSLTWRGERDRGALKMPAFRDRVSEKQIGDLVAFVMARAGSPEPDEVPAIRGRERAAAMGCFGCHGPGGLLARPNPGSLKGYVPSWDGADFPELVRDRAEFEEWVRSGVSRRFDAHPLARFFLRRAVLRMPAYRAFLAPADVDTLWAYVTWLRSGAR